jgi:hypothetical protein
MMRWTGWRSVLVECIAVLIAALTAAWIRKVFVAGGTPALSGSYGSYGRSAVWWSRDEGR